MATIQIYTHPITWSIGKSLGSEYIIIVHLGREIIFVILANFTAIQHDHTEENPPKEQMT